MTTAYNILVRHSLVDAEKKIIKEYKSFEEDKPDELVQRWSHKIQWNTNTNYGRRSFQKTLDYKTGE